MFPWSQRAQRRACLVRHSELSTLNPAAHPTSHANPDGMACTARQFAAALNSRDDASPNPASRIARMVPSRSCRASGKRARSCGNSSSAAAQSSAEHAHESSSFLPRGTPCIVSVSSGQPGGRNGEPGTSFAPHQHTLLLPVKTLQIVPRG